MSNKVWRSNLSNPSFTENKVNYDSLWNSVNDNTYYVLITLSYKYRKVNKNKEGT